MRVRRVITKVVLPCAVLFLLQSTLAQTPQKGQAGKRLAIRAGHLIDGKSDAPVNSPTILIEGGRITAVGPNLAIPAGMDVIDLGNATLLPGLIDTHTHLLSNYKFSIGSDENMILAMTQMSTAKRALMGAALGREDLEAGITAVRDLGNSGVNGDVALRDAINAGWVVGPRINASTRALSAAGGQLGSLSAETQKIIDQEYVVIGSVDEARRAVRQAFFDGADCIKVIVNTGPRILSLEEMKAIVEEAHRAGRKVSAHAIGDLATRISAEAGVDSIEHAYVVPDAVLKMMAEKKIFLVPTDIPWDGYKQFLKSSDLSPEQLKQQEGQMQKMLEGLHERIQRAMKAGVRIAAGSDEYYEWSGKTRGQASLMMLRAYAESGMSPLEIIRAATVNAAELLGWQDRIGSVEVKKFADLIAVQGDPLQDIGELEHVKFVMKGGIVIKNELGASMPMKTSK